MNIIQAMQALENGKKIRRVDWLDSNCCLRLDKQKGEIKDEYNNNMVGIPIDNFFKDEWEIYTEYFDFFEAMRRIKEGKKVTNTDANSCGFIYKLDEDNHTIILDELNCRFDFINKEINSDKWYEVD